MIDKTEERRLEFHEKTVASMTDKYGLVGGGGATADPGPSAAADSGGQGLEISKPKISFRKRKVISVRERTDDD